jgi:O-antigen/teichoic acid export membrane protein
MIRDARLWLSERLLTHDPHIREIIRGTVVALVLRVLGAGLTLLFSVVIARLFGASGAGAFFLAFTVMTIGTVFGRLGLDNTLLRLVAAHASAGDWGAVKSAYQSGMRLAIGSSVAVGGLIILASPKLATDVFHNESMTSLLRYMGLAVPPVVIFTLYGQMLRGLQRVWSSVLVGAVWAPAFAVAILVVMGASRGPLAATWAYLCGATLTALAAWWWWKRITPAVRFISTASETRNLLKSSMPLLWVSSMSMALNWIATFALGILASDAEVGVFNAASRLALLVSFVLVAVDNISAPKFAAIYRTGDSVALARTARNTVRLTVLLAAPMLIVLTTIPRLVMAMFGPEFRAGGSVLVVLALSQAVNVVAGSVGSLLIMSGHERQVRDSNTLAASTCLILAVALVPGHGALGAAIAVSAALVARNVYEVVMVRRHLGIGLLLGPQSRSSSKSEI